MLLPVSLFMVCHAVRLECVKSESPQPQSTWPGVLHPGYGVALLLLCRCLGGGLLVLAQEMVAAVVPSGDIVVVESAWDALLRSAYTHVGIRYVCGVRVISLWIWETWCSSLSLCGE